MTKIYVKAWASIARHNCQEEVFQEEEGIVLRRLLGVDKFIDPMWRNYARRAGRYTKLMLAASSEGFRQFPGLTSDMPLNRGIFLVTATGESEDAVAINQAIANPATHMISPTHFVSTVSQTALLALASRIGTTSDVYAIARQSGGLAAGLRLAVRAIGSGRLDEAWVGVGEICTATPFAHSKRVGFFGSNSLRSFHEGGAWIVLSKTGYDQSVSVDVTISDQERAPDPQQSYCPSDDAIALCEWLGNPESDHAWAIQGSGMEFRFKKSQ